MHVNKVAYYVAHAHISMTHTDTKVHLLVYTYQISDCLDLVIRGAYKICLEVALHNRQQKPRNYISQVIALCTK